MKKVLCTIAIALFIYSHTLYSQTEKGKTLIGISSALGIGGNSNGFAFNSSKFKSDDFESDPIKSSSFNFSPRAGYFIANNFVIGAEAFYGFAKQDNSVIQIDIVIEDIKTTTIGAGPFVRYYFQTNTVLPFVEVGLVFGTSNTTFGDSDSDNKSSLFNYGGGAGIAIPLGEKVSFDALLGYSHFENKPKENNDNNSRTIFNSFSLRLGFSIYLGNAQSQKTSQEN